MDKGLQALDIHAIAHPVGLLGWSRDWRRHLHEAVAVQHKVLGGGDGEQCADDAQLHRLPAAVAAPRYERHDLRAPPSSLQRGSTCWRSRCARTNVLLGTRLQWPRHPRWCVGTASKPLISGAPERAYLGNDAAVVQAAGCAALCLQVCMGHLQDACTLLGQGEWACKHGRHGNARRVAHAWRSEPI